MNKLEKDLLFYSNYCIHSNKLINSISKTPLHNNIFYICIDDSNIKVPNFITRVPSIFLVKEKRVLVEDEIDQWTNMKISSQQPQSKEEQYQQQMRQQQMEHQRQMQQQMEQQLQNKQNNQLEMPHPQQNQPHPQQHPQQNQPPQYQQQENNNEPEEIMAYHSNEMGSSMSDTYSFIEDSGNSSINHNFTFLEGNMPTNTNINTPKDFNSNNNQVKTKLDTDFDKLLESRNNESFAKGIQRI